MAYGAVLEAQAIWCLRATGDASAVVSVAAHLSCTCKRRVKHSTSGIVGRPAGFTAGARTQHVYSADLPINVAGMLMAQYADDIAVMYRSLRPQLVQLISSGWQTNSGTGSFAGVLLSARRRAPLCSFTDV